MAQEECKDTASEGISNARCIATEARVDLIGLFVANHENRRAKVYIA